MHAEWSVECGADDPVVVVPWSCAPETPGCAFVDLRENPEAIDAVAEAERHPPLARALRSLNASRSPVFTSKCDAWRMDEEEIAQLTLDLGWDAIGENAELDSAPSGGAARCGFASYIDCICREQALFAALARHEHVLRSITRLAAPLDRAHTALDCVLRPGLLHFDRPRQGYAISVYVKSLGDDAQQAEKRWAAALADVVAVLRRREAIR